MINLARGHTALMSVNAVLTTGIYCRPGCAARPHPRNVREFGIPAAAEAAGFRPCLRCRPYRSGSRPSWASTPELVCRAVQLISAGALDADNESQLARALGVSGRHLRRLFVATLGVTPDALARSRRAHFARRLLDDTDLSVLEIAAAAGFGSVRQLNRACQEIFRDTPRELRARRWRGDRLIADGGLPLRLGYEGPLEREAMLAYLAVRAIPGVESVADGVYRRTVRIDGDPGVIELGPGGPEHLLLRAHLPHWEGLIHHVERARRIFGLDSAHAEAAAHLSGDPAIGPLVRARPGLRVPGTWDPFELGVRAIIGQQVSVRGAGTITGRLVQRLGEPLPGVAPLGLTHIFPAPATVAAGDLAGLGLTEARQRAIRAFAGAVQEGALKLDCSRPLAELVASISALPGLGPWTAHYIALRLGEPDAFPDGDLGLRRALAGLRDARAGSLTQTARAWSPWRATAAIHLWCAAAG